MTQTLRAPFPASPACACCGGRDAAPHFRVLSRCADCGHIWAEVSLSPDEITRLYREDYFRGQEYGDYLADEASHRTNFAYRLRQLRQLAPDVRSVFEVGCAYGLFLAECARHGLDCAGVDVCDEPVAHAVRHLNQRAVCGDFLQLALRPGRYDAFCLWDTIEHLPNPEAFVARAAELLPAGGWLFLTTGDIGSRYAKWRGSRWRMIHPPTHLHYFSSGSIRRMLGRLGFEVAVCRSTPFYRNFGECLARVAALGKGASRWVARLAQAVTPGAVTRRGFWLDLGDIMYVAARKKG